MPARRSAPIGPTTRVAVRATRVRLVLPLLLGMLGLALLGGDRAHAQSGDRIVFDFTSNSTFSLLGGTVQTPPDGSIDVGHGIVFIEAATSGAYLSGAPVVLDNITVSGSVSKLVGGSTQVDGTFSASQPSPLVGSLAPALDGADFTDPLGLDLDIAIGCTGPGCASLGLPASDVGLSLLSLSFLPINDLGVVGGASIQATVPIEVDGVLGTLDLVGVEVSRTFIPEPGTFVLVATGLGVLAARRRGGVV